MLCATVCQGFSLSGHRLLVWTKALGNGFGVSAAAREPEAVCGQEGRAGAMAECSQTHLRLHLCSGAVVQGQAWTERFHTDPEGRLAERPQYLVPGEGQRASLRDSLHHTGKYETLLLHFWLLCRNCSLTTASLEGLTTLPEACKHSCQCP